MAPPALASAVFPDTGAMANAVDAALQMTRIGALRYADYTGAAIPELIESARAWLLASATLKDGAEVPLPEPSTAPDSSSASPSS